MMIIAGIDEVGRGCLAGPVVAAAVILDPFRPIDGLADSKMLNPGRRQVLAQQIKTHAISWSIGRAEATEIDRLNILQASLLAMRRAFLALPCAPEWVRVDGRHFPDIPCGGEAIIGGDGTEPCVSAASILAKVFRDRELGVLDLLYPGYGFSVHMAYPTKAHRVALSNLGPSQVHRFTFSPVAKYLESPRPVLNERADRNGLG